MANLLPRLFVAALCLSSTAAFAQTAAAVPPGSAPPATNPKVVVRPAAEIRAGMSPPTSEHAANITPADTASVIAAPLPTPPVPYNAPPSAFLADARKALAANRTGEAQEAMERAETRDLPRAIPQSDLGKPIHDPVVDRVQQALYALGDGNPQGAEQQLAQGFASK